MVNEVYGNYGTLLFKTKRNKVLQKISIADMAGSECNFSWIGLACISIGNILYHSFHYHVYFPCFSFSFLANASFTTMIEECLRGSIWEKRALDRHVLQTHVLFK